MTDNILQEAQAAVFGERAATYGHPAQNFAAIAALWNGWVEATLLAKGPNGATSVVIFTAEDVADLMILTKLARLMTTPDHRDSLVDIAGYAETRARVVGLDA